VNERLKLSLLPSSPSLAGAEIELVDELAREMRLRKAIEPFAGKYDYVLIDCPPSLGLLTVNGLMAAIDGVIVPVQCEYLALEGLGQLTRTIERVRSLLFPELNVRGVVLTMLGRTNLFHVVIADLKKRFPIRLQACDAAQYPFAEALFIRIADLRLCAHMWGRGGV
jgi:chromosome partitioning protein